MACIKVQALYYMEIVALLSYAGVLAAISLTLSFRLYHTFEQSALKIAQNQRLCIIILYIMFVLMGIIALVTYFGRYTLILLISDGIIFVLYVVINIYGMVLFSQKMYALIKMRRKHTDDTMIFNAKQKRLLYLTTKYVTLLSLATISTWITMIIALVLFAIFGANQESLNITRIFMNFDFVINIICLYLQYPFNEKYYVKYCICFGDICLHLLTKHESERRQQSMQEAIQLGEKSPTTQNFTCDGDVEIEELMEKDVIQKGK